MPEPIRPVLTEQMVQTPPPGMEGWRQYRIEYDFEGQRPEGVVWLPPHADPSYLEGWLQVEAIDWESEDA